MSALDDVFAALSADGTDILFIPRETLEQARAELAALRKLRELCMAKPHEGFMSVLVGDPGVLQTFTCDSLCRRCAAEAVKS